MRIRKLAKLAAASSTLRVNAVTSEAIDTKVCKLNRSPWDMLSFPPQSIFLHNQKEENGEDENGVVRMEAVDPNLNATEQEVKKEEEREEKIWCRKRGSKGWRCVREAKEGHSLCEHHLALRRCNRYQSCHNSAVSGEDNGRNDWRRRPLPASVSDYYYYSGFGPRWSRKRGSQSQTADALQIAAGDGDSPAIDAPGSGQEVATCVEERNDDYCENAADEFDVVDEVDGKIARRLRRPRKARSLKSLL